MYQQPTAYTIPHVLIIILRNTPLAIGERNRLEKCPIDMNVVIINEFAFEQCEIKMRMTNMKYGRELEKKMFVTRHNIAVLLFHVRILFFHCKNLIYNSKFTCRL